MSSTAFSARIDGKFIRCSVESATALTAPVFCFSLMAPPAVVSGGILIRQDGGYGEVQLPDLALGRPHEFTLRYAAEEFAPVNRAWLPLGAYLRCGAKVVPLPAMPSGISGTGDVPAPVAPPTEGLCLVPAPTAWHPEEGYLSVEHVTPQPGLWDGVEQLAVRCNLPPLQTDLGTPLNATKDATLPPDGYRLQIRSDGIEMSFGGETGAHYAGITLLMLRFTHDESLPCGTIEDQPRFEWRGQHLDCARHFYATATIEKLLDLMALLKLNRFHWHFSDDEAFRLEIESAPELWQTTRLRGEGHLVPGVFGGGASAGGSYSKADALNLIAHAKGYHIEIMPEIEFPAHALGFARAYPETRDPDDIGTEVSVQGYAENVLNPALPETWSRIEAIAEEVGALFPFSMLHLGADELPDGTWSGSPSVAALKAEQGLETRDDVLGWALSQLAEKLSKAGIRSAAWEEAARGCTGGIGNNALLFSWTGQAPGIEAARAGYDIVMCPAQHVYLDMAHTSAPEDWGAAWAAFVSLRDTLNWNVIPEPDIADRVVGVEGTFWSEFTTSDHEIEPMIAPRLFGVASKAWCVAETVSEETFQSSSRRLCDLLTVMGWKWNSNCF